MIDEMTAEEALAELRNAGYEHAKLWRQHDRGSATIYLNDGPLRGTKRSGRHIWSASWHRDTFACATVWCAIHDLVSGK